MKLLQALQAGNGQNAEGIARACGVSRRTVFRDLETLRAASVPPTDFTPSEALSIIALAAGAADRAASDEHAADV